MKKLLPIAGVLLVIIAFNAFFVVPETHKAVLLYFGELSAEKVNSGFNLKLPFVQKSQTFDARLQNFVNQESQYFTNENEVLIVDFYANWKVTDADTYYEATGGNQSRLRRLLTRRIDSGLRDNFGNHTKADVISGERDALMQSLLNELNASVEKELGVFVVDIRIIRIELPSSASSSVYNRMIAERERLANENRAEGCEISERLKSEADRKRVVLLADAYKDAEILRGQGDAESARIYANAYGKDPDFYAFTRSLKAYVKSFSGDDFLVIDPSSDFFAHFGQNSKDSN